MSDYSDRNLTFYIKWKIVDVIVTCVKFSGRLFMGKNFAMEMKKIRRRLLKGK